MGDPHHFGRLAFRGLLVLTLINLFNYLDRYVVAALVESLKKSDLKLLDSEAGLLMTGFVIVYMVTSPIFGALGDRLSRPRLLAFGVFVWSLATAMAGMAQSFMSLFFARAAVGIGEAAYGTIAPALIADYFPKSQRGRVYSIFFSAIPIGSALGYVIGGYVDQHFGWRMAFYVAGVPGILLAFWALFLFDPPRGIQEDPEDQLDHQASKSDYKSLASNLPFIKTVLGYAAYTFALGGLAFWMPAFLERVRGVPKAEATMTFGMIVVGTGFIGTFLGGYLADLLFKRNKQAYLWVSGIATLLAVPFAVIALTSPERSIYISATAIAETLLFASTGPVNSALINAVPAGIRALSVAICNFTIHLMGDVPSPPLIGYISDRSSLSNGVMLVPFAVALAGIIWIYAAWTEGKAPRRRGSI
ncbi:MAG: MFS transporter [Bdellovibrionota bacterium]